ncbi:MAG: hypothetical protein ACQEXQ_22905 [Bacillota bacterium]
MKSFIMVKKGQWITKWVIAASIAFIPLAASPTIGHAQVIEEQGYANEALSEMHAKVDAYVFTDKVDELEAQGIQVTNTGPVGEYIEIGIIDYTDEKAAYLYDVFGTELVKVVEGVQAVTLDNTLEITTDDKEMSTTSIDVPQTDDSEMAVTTVSDAVTTTGASEVNETAAANGANTAWIVVIAAAALGAILYLGRKLGLSRK